MITLYKAKNRVLTIFISDTQNYAIYSFKVPLKAKIVQILFSRMHKNYAKYTFQTFTVDGPTIAYLVSDRKYGLNKNVIAYA